MGHPKNVAQRNGIDILPEGRIGIGTKWIFKEKKNGVFRARLVAKGYDQIAGVDFQENFAPVTSDVTFRMLLILLEYYPNINKMCLIFLKIY